MNLLAAIGDGVIPSDFLGPTAALAVALVAVGVLWREDRKNSAARISDLITQYEARLVDAAEYAKREIASRDVTITRLVGERDLNRDGWRVQTDANAKLAEAWEARNRAEDGRRRRSDGS